MQVTDLANESDPFLLIVAAKNLLESTQKFLDSGETWESSFKNRRQQLLAFDQITFCQEILDRLQIVFMKMSPLEWTAPVFPEDQELERRAQTVRGGIEL